MADQTPERTTTTARGTAVEADGDLYTYNVCLVYRPDDGQVNISIGEGTSLDDEADFYVPARCLRALAQDFYEAAWIIDLTDEDAPVADEGAADEAAQGEPARLPLLRDVLSMDESDLRALPMDALDRLSGTAATIAHSAHAYPEHVEIFARLVHEVQRRNAEAQAEESND